MTGQMWGQLQQGGVRLTPRFLLVAIWWMAVAVG